MRADGRIELCAAAAGDDGAVGPLLPAANTTAIAAVFKVAMSAANSW